MNSFFLIALFCVGAAVAYPTGLVVSPYAAHAHLGYAAAYPGHGAPLGHDGRVVDTPEVAHAKIAHYAAYSNAAHENHAVAHHAVAPLAHSAYSAYASPLAYSAYAAPLAHHAYAAPLAHYGSWAHGGAPIGHDGRVVDTPEVAHAKAAHFSAHAAAHHNNHYGYGWH